MIQEIETLVRQGDLANAKKQLSRIKVNQVPRKQALRYANLARRVGLFHLSLRMLAPPGGFHEVAWSAEETIEYAASLRCLGILSEAEKLLEQIDKSKYPHASLYLSFCLMSRWDFESALPLLNAYINSYNEGSYESYVGKINLLQSYIFIGHLGAARPLLSELLSGIDSAKYSLAHRKCLELAAQYEIANESWDCAIRYLKDAQNVLKTDQDSLDSMFVAKWIAVADSAKIGDVTPGLLKVKDRALKLAHWETIRDCDFYIAKISGDQSALVRLYFGTPFTSYREKILKALPKGSEIPDTFLWSGAKPIPKTGLVLDLARAQSEDGRIELAPGLALHRLFIALSRDFYRPVPNLSLFTFLFPEERLDPHTSPNRIRQVIKRFRSWLKEQRLPLELREDNGNYHLEFIGPMSIMVLRDGLPIGTKQELEFLKLCRSLGPRRQSFTSAEASAALNSSLSVTKRLLKWAVETGRLRVEGQTTSTRYTFVNPASEA